MTGSGAHRRVVRTIGILFAIGAAVFGLLTAPLIVAQTPTVLMSWTVAALAAQLALPLLIGAAAATSRIRLAQVLATTTAVAGVAVLGSVPLVFPADASRAAAPWPLQLTAIGTTAAALGSRPLVVGVDVVLTGTLVVIDRTATAGATLGLIPVQDGAYAALFSAVFAALAVGARGAARSVDDAAAAALGAAARTRDEHVHAEERARVDGLVHDRVLTTLLVAARSPVASAAAAADAADAIGELERLATSTSTTTPVAGEALLDRIRALLTAVAPSARLVAEGVLPSTRYPAAVAEVLLGAIGEAVRNSRAHAGAGTSIEVHVEQSGRGVEVAVIDDGAGFVPADVPADRLGIAGSIVARLERVGGTAEVRSHPGRGTAVRLCWPAR